jgi:hypothetical protein
MNTESHYLRRWNTVPKPWWADTCACWQTLAHWLTLLTGYLATRCQSSLRISIMRGAKPRPQHRSQHKIVLALVRARASDASRRFRFLDAWGLVLLAANTFHVTSKVLSIFARGASASPVKHLWVHWVQLRAEWRLCTIRKLRRISILVRWI